MPASGHKHNFREVPGTRIEKYIENRNQNINPTLSWSNRISQSLPPWKPHDWQLSSQACALIPADQCQLRSCQRFAFPANDMPEVRQPGWIFSFFIPIWTRYRCSKRSGLWLNTFVGQRQCIMLLISCPIFQCPLNIRMSSFCARSSIIYWRGHLC